MILLTRAKEDSLNLSAILQKKGFETLIEPMIEILPLKYSEHGIIPSNIVFTSRNGVACCLENNNRSARVFTVGDSTYKAAKDQGFVNIINAGGNVDDLFSVILEHLAHDHETLIHYCGENKAGDLVNSLQKLGVKAEEKIVYKAVATKKLSPSIISALLNKKIRSALFFSPRTANIFLNLIRNLQMTNLLANVNAFCISNETAKMIDTVNWAGIVIARRPTQSHLLELIYKG